MNTRELVTMALFAAIGVALHAIIPPIFFGMKPDMMLTMMFLAIILFPKAKNVLVMGIVTGLLSGLTTAFPGGLVPNLIDKPVTAFIFFFLYIAVRKFSANTVSAAILTAIGTIVSGLVFLTAAYFIVGLPAGAGFMALFLTVVLPAVALNTIAMIFVHPIVLTIMKRSKIVSSN
ncbi:tryptophan transporter [Metabacillus sp. RGM 3146]|uniref:tryptophan transporter n=1 Tax=Metabacillus sp. RGM 3146 TaxID=3401092 RepID=UPI003B9C3A15